MTFEEWYKTKDKEEFCSYSAQEGFKAGQESMKAERDALQARIDGGLRVKAVYYRGSYDCRRYASEIGHNATLIPDEGVKL